MGKSPDCAQCSYAMLSDPGALRGARARISRKSSRVAGATATPVATTWLRRCSIARASDAPELAKIGPPWAAKASAADASNPNTPPAASITTVRVKVRRLGDHAARTPHTPGELRAAHTRPRPCASRASGMRQNGHGRDPEERQQKRPRIAPTTTTIKQPGISRPLRNCGSKVWPVAPYACCPASRQPMRLPLKSAGRHRLATALLDLLRCGVDASRDAREALKGIVRSVEFRLLGHQLDQRGENGASNHPSRNNSPPARPMRRRRGRVKMQ